MRVSGERRGVCKLARIKIRNEYGKTWQGKYFNVVGYFFSAYCIWKIFISTVNIVFDRVGKVDPVTKAIEILVPPGYEIDVRFWSQQISFLLIGIIAVTSIRGLLITIAKFFNAISSRKSSNLIVLVLAHVMVGDDRARAAAYSREQPRAAASCRVCRREQFRTDSLQGMYFVSSVLLIRMNMPYQYRFISATSSLHDCRLILAEKSSPRCSAIYNSNSIIAGLTLFSSFPRSRAFSSSTSHTSKRE